MSLLKKILILEVVFLAGNVFILHQQKQNHYQIKQKIRDAEAENDSLQNYLKSINPYDSLINKIKKLYQNNELFWEFYKEQQRQQKSKEYEKRCKFI
ncbi:MAG: hypothetical protein IB618_03245 [Candidatus Pacearchaeota archaeon]|nr:MAG: hypothetical protein IB618_03245 [Candidatus Pacearchaeota archaeon]